MEKKTPSGWTLKKVLYVVVGCLSVGLGAVGAVLPILPTVPFLLLAAFCFARSSEKLDAWFKGTRLYKENLADYAAGRGMTRRTKCRIMATVTLLMAVGFAVMFLKGVTVGCIVLGCVWAAHVVYFCLFVKTAPAPETAAEEG